MADRTTSNHDFPERGKAGRKLAVGVAFGGVAPEHEVSVISSLQAAHAISESERYEPVPIYIAKDGTWYTGPAERLFDVDAYKDLDRLRSEAVPVRLEPTARATLRLVERRGRVLPWQRTERREIDVMLLGFHGGSGEDGGLQGLCETFNVPYTGSGILGSAIGMDKVQSKMLCRDQGIPIVDFAWLREADWADREEEKLDELEAEIDYPVIVKPARLGSSIGIGRASRREELDAAVEEALRYDDKVVIERAVEELREINCAVLGHPGVAEPSALEEPLPSGEDEVLTFQDKYMREGGGGGSKEGGGGSESAVRRNPKAGQGAGEGGQGGMASAERVLPAELSEERTREIQELGVRIFRLLECAGVARIDFMIDEATGEVFFNEINTIPGSFSFYLWEATDVAFDELLHRMIEIARDRHRARNTRVRSYDVNLLAEGSFEGAKE